LAFLALQFDEIPGLGFLCK